jgi:hypothetical protein
LHRVCSSLRAGRIAVASKKIEGLGVHIRRQKRDFAKAL